MPHRVESVDSSKIGPKAFFNKYIKARCPCVMKSAKLESIDEQLKDLKNLWSNSYLRGRCGDAKVRVERRGDANTGRFGLGKEDVIRFSDFLDSIVASSSSSSLKATTSSSTKSNSMSNDAASKYVKEKDDAELLYLTTQELDYSTEGMPSIISPPLTDLVGDFPWRLALAGNLITQNINMWFGSSSRPTTSGLHHDFHDNFYILLRGRKDITLFPFSDAARMHTVGEIVKVHPNGRINYKGQETLADGSAPSSLRALEASNKLQNAVDRLSAKQGGDDIDDEIEDEIDDALDALLDAERDDDDYDDDGEEEEDDDSDGDDDFGDDDDYNSDIAEIEGDDDDEVEAEEEEEEEEEEGGNNSDSSSSGTNDSLSGTKRKKKGNNISSSGKRSKRSKVESRVSSSKGDSTPSNFSQIDTSKDIEDIFKEFPDFELAYKRRYEVSLRAGDVLYIPAGWFHEVRSSNDSDNNDDGKEGVASAATATATAASESKSPMSKGCGSTAVKGSSSNNIAAKGGEAKEDGEGGGHLALNYWFHPPDGASFENPYTTPFWQSDWDSRGLL